MMQFKLVSWNVRGLNNRDKRVVVKSLMGDWKTDIICLQETKLEGYIIELATQIWGKMDQSGMFRGQSYKRRDYVVAGQQGVEGGSFGDRGIHSNLQV